MEFKVERLNNLDTIKLGPRLWVLDKPLVFRITCNLSGMVWIVCVPPGFFTDGCSVPSALWAICPPMAGTTGEGGILHDFLYSADCQLKWERWIVDSVFYCAIIANGTGRVRAEAIYAGVRAFGWHSFRKGYSSDKFNIYTAYPGLDITPWLNSPGLAH